MKKKTIIKPVSPSERLELLEKKVADDFTYVCNRFEGISEDLWELEEKEIKRQKRRQHNAEYLLCLVLVVYGFFLGFRAFEAFKKGGRL